MVRGLAAQQAADTSQLNAIERRGSIPEITWEPWDASKGLYKSQPRYRLSNIIDGKFDSYIRAWARSLAPWKHPVLLRFAQEMDGNWFPWGDYANGNQPGQFVQAWRHVHRHLRARRRHQRQMGLEPGVRQVDGAIPRQRATST